VQQRIIKAATVHPFSMDCMRHFSSLDFAESNTPACDEGETILLSLHCIIALISSVQRLVKAEHAATPLSIPISITISQDGDQPSLKTLVESILAPCLSALQHFP
jgi:hypothetical protein